MYTLSHSQCDFLQLIRIALNQEIEELRDNINWEYVYNLSIKHNVNVLVWDAISMLYENDYNHLPNKMLKFRWMGNVLKYEKRYREHEENMMSLSKFYNDNGYKMMVLKGYGLSLNYPKPFHRTVGDLDIWTFNKYKDVDALVEEKLHVAIDTSHHHHTVFQYKHEFVENHYDFINVHTHLSNKGFEKKLKALAPLNYKEVDINGQKLCLPSDNFHAYFVLRHTGCHFASGEMIYRQIIDWAMLVKLHHTDIDWADLYTFSEKMQTLQFLYVINEISIEWLGVPREFFHFPINYMKDLYLRDKILYDLFNPIFSEQMPHHAILKKWYWMVCRWWCNRWKQKIIYKENLYISFFTQLWGHLLKPTSLTCHI